MPTNPVVLRLKGASTVGIMVNEKRRENRGECPRFEPLLGVRITGRNKESEMQGESLDDGNSIAGVALTPEGLHVCTPCFVVEATCPVERVETSYCDRLN